ncbi:MAG: CDP-glycerol glycerophosphotransferase family protein [Patescibacteria group bacterium]
MSKQKTILITSFHVLVSRNILLAPFLSLLTARGFRVVLVMPKKKEQYFRTVFEGPNVIVIGIPNLLNRRDNFFKDIALAAVRTEALSAMRHRNMGIERPFSQRIFSWAPFVRRFIPFLYRIIMPHHSYHAIFEQYKPDLVFSTDVFSANDCRVLLEARSHGTPAVAMVRSWDNLTTKGGFRVVPDTLVVQNEIAQEEAVTFHDIDCTLIRVVGIPHYDNYAKEPPHSRREICALLGIPEGKHFFVYAPLGDRIMKVGTVVHRHGYDEAMAKLLDTLLPPDTYLVVRRPPTDTVTIDRSVLSSRVVFSEPGVRFGEGIKGIQSSEMGKDDDDSLFSTLFHSSGVINPFSSLCVDAAFLDRPIIIPAFDPVPVGYWESLLRLQQFEHFRPIGESKGVALVRTPDELALALKRYAANPSEDAEGRAELARTECFARDGGSSQRLLDALTEKIT